MPIIEAEPPKQSVAKLLRGLKQLVPLKESRKRWMQIHPGDVRKTHILHPHPLYSIRLTELLAGRTFAASLHRSGWIYFIQIAPKQPALAEVSIVARKHVHFRLTEGPLAKRALHAIQKARNNPRLRRHSFQLRSLRVESLHVFVLWLRESARNEFWLPVTPIGQSVAANQWLTRTEFVDVLLREARRVLAIQENAKGLLTKL
jgi:hypothetical protein